MNTLAFVIATIIFCLLNLLGHASYKRLLIMKSEDKTAECINGKFYYILTEEEFGQYEYYKRRDNQ
jgi:hypothetical protein